MTEKSNVIPLGGYTKGKVPPDKVLNAAIDKLDFVFIAGEDKDGGEYFAASSGRAEDIDRILWLLEKFKFKLMRGDFS